MLLNSACFSSPISCFPVSSLINLAKISFSMLCTVPVLAKVLESNVTPKRLLIWMANLMAMIEVSPA